MTPEEIDKAARKVASEVLGIAAEKINSDDTIVYGFKKGVEWYADSQCAPLREEIEMLKDSKWISVKDRMPEVSKIMVAYKFGVAEAMFFQGKFIKDVENEFPEVTHWQPLPEPPKQ